MTIQDIFDYANDYYNRARSIVESMGDAVSAVMPDFKLKNAYCQLDIIVQYVLLETAIADGKFLEAEGEFIDKITDSFDLINLFNDVPDGMNWHWFALHVPFAEIKNIIANVRLLAHEHMQSFAKLFAIVDASVFELDILGDLVECIAKIATCFILCDGSGDEIESKVASQITNECLVAPWVEMRDRARNSKG